MTHEELLAKMASFSCCSGAHELALEAVIELHQPKSSEYFPVDVCVACSPDIDRWIAYPCPTIQAIQAVI